MNLTKTYIVQQYQPTHYTAEQSLAAEPGSIPLESRQWLFPFKAATFSTVLGGKRENGKFERRHYIQSLFLSLFAYVLYVCTLLLYLPAKCMHSRLYLPPSRLDVCVYIHTHTQGHTVCPLTNFMYSKRKLRTFEETIGGSFNLKICVDME